MSAGEARVDVSASYDSTPLVLAEIGLETVRAGLKFGSQIELPDGTGCEWAAFADAARAQTNRAAEDGTLTWVEVLREEVYEAFAESDPERLREELIQVAAVAVRWAQALDQRAAEAIVAGGDT
jgi:hypothetical protein